MKNIFSWVPVLGLCLFLIQGTGCAKSPQASGLAPADFQAALAARPDALLVDIYLQEKPRKIGLPEAQVLKVGEQKPREAFSDVDHARPVYLYCGDGRGSGQIAKILDDMGFQEVYSLEGGVKAWKEAGLPVEPVQNLRAFGQEHQEAMP
jgi:rhodanese-related sulfurtransferase